MVGRDIPSDSDAELRKRAEERIRQKTDPSLETAMDLSVEESRQLLQELRIHQIELEMQNDELRRTQEELETSRKLYFDLYDLAPVGYCITSERGLILKANLIVSSLLGKPRQELINNPISRFILTQDQQIYYHHLNLLFETLRPQTFELRIARTGNPPLWVRIDATLSNHEENFSANLILTDISESKAMEHALKERIKELNFFFSFSALLEEPGIGVDDILKQTVRRMPAAWQFPEITEACIELEGQLFQTKGFRTTKWMQTCDILIERKPVGKIKVCCLENPQTVNEGPFLKEEHYLIAAIAERIGHTLDRIRGGMKLGQSEVFLRTIVKAITNPFAVINADSYTIELANAAYGGDNVIGQKCHVVLHQKETPCTGDDYPCSVLEVKRTGKPFVGKHVHRDVRGDPITMETYAYPVLDPKGSIIQVIEYQIDVTGQRRIENELKQRAAELEEMNTALKVLLKRREEDKREIQEKIFANFQLTLSPILSDLEKTLTQDKQHDIVKILRSDLKNILSPFSKKLSDKMILLTPTEIHVANLIKLGNTNKEIAELLNCSPNTISRHRDNIRKKTGLKNQKINLRSFLLSLE